MQKVPPYGVLFGPQPDVVPSTIKEKIRLKAWTSHWRATKRIKRPKWENHESPKDSFTWPLILSIKCPVRPAKWLSSQFPDPLLINCHNGRLVPYLYCRIKLKKSTYKASAAIRQLPGKLGKLTIPTVPWDTPVHGSNQSGGWNRVT